MDKEIYLKHGRCPYCRSRIVYSVEEPFIGIGDMVRATIACEDCKKTWDELYQIFDIDETFENGKDT